MMQRIIQHTAVLISLLGVFYGVSLADDDSLIRGEDKIYNIVGPIMSIEKNAGRLYVQDERKQELYSFFVHSNKLKDLKEGERVRVYYRQGRDAAVSVKKMTELEYKKDGQNLGYFYKKP